uniref:Uncharacterized protein n=1 Tax=Octopus bimaculoides TaxID=37653 RepID=A0A0L8FFZ5_OCTBM
MELKKKALTQAVVKQIMVWSIKWSFCIERILKGFYFQTGVKQSNPFNHVFSNTNYKELGSGTKRCREVLTDRN